MATGALALLAPLGAASMASATTSAPAEQASGLEATSTVGDTVEVADTAAGAQALERAMRHREATRQKLAGLPAGPEAPELSSWSALSAERPGTTSASMFHDPVGDVNGDYTCFADVLGHGAAYRQQTVELRVHLGCATDPLSSEGWTSGLTGATWVLDLDLDGAPDVAAELYAGDGEIAGGVFGLDGAPMCQGTGEWDGANTYSLSIARECIGSRPAFRLATEFLWDHRNGGDFGSCCSWDHAPEGRDFDGPVFAPRPVEPPATAPADGSGAPPALG